VTAIAARYQVASGAIYHHLNQRTVLRRDQGPRHGTPAGYQWHHRHGRTPCPPCAAARAASERRYAQHRMTGSE